MNRFLTGEELFGDDFGASAIEQWHKEESDAYAQLGAADRDSYRYVYHALNWAHGFRHIRHQSINLAVGLGSAYGDEFHPLTNRIERIVIVDSSPSFSPPKIGELTPEYVIPTPNSQLPLTNNSAQLITCFGVLHHIPNVTTTLSDCHRILAEDGMFMVREPIVSLGDWRRPRIGLTKNERGIPIAIFDRIIGECGFEVVSRKLCMFHPFTSAASRLGVRPYSSRTATRLDAILSYIFRKNTAYHRTAALQKLGPTNVFYVLRKVIA